MEIAQLRIVREIHAAGSLSKASMRLGKAQSIISRHLATFEKECGGRIFYRHGRGVQLTELGEKIMPQVDRILGEVEQLIGTGQQDDDAVAGTVHITISSAVCDKVVPALFARIREAHPLIRLQFFEGYSSAIDRVLEDEDTDIAVLLINGTSPGHNQEPICQFDTWLVAPPGLPPLARKEILFSELEGLPLLLASEPSLARHAISEMAASRGMTLDVAAEVNSTASMQALFDAGAGYLTCAVGCGPAAALSPMGRMICEGRLNAARIVDPDLKRTLVVGSAPGLSQRAEAVRKEAIRILRELTRRNASDGDQPDRAVTG